MNLLERSASIHFGERQDFVSFTSAQVSMDAMRGSFATEASNPRMLAAMVGGGLAYRLTRLGSLSVLASLNRGGSLAALLGRGASYTTALGAESLAFTSIHRSFSSQSPENFGKEWLHTMISLGSLKFFSALAQRQNIIFQHFFTDVGMLTAHQIAAWVHLEERSTESLWAQFIRAESMNWQMKAGMALTYALIPSLSYFEKSLDLSLKSQIQERSFIAREAQRVSRLLPEIPVMSAAESFTGRVARYRRRAHQSVKPLFVGTVIDTLTGAKARPRRAQKASFVSDVRRKCLEMLPLSLRVRAETLGTGYGVVFLPGMYNHPPDPAWMNLLSAAFEHGGAVISTAAGWPKIEAQALYSMVGENSRVLQPHWEMEVPIIIRRMALALREPSILGEAKKLVIIGHSKGGLLAHALQVLQQVYAENAAVFPQKFKDLYPGLEHLAPGELREVMEVLKRSKFILLGSPVEGIGYNVLVELVDHLLLEGSAEGFDQQRLVSYFEALGMGPETADLLVLSKMPGLFRSLLQISHPGNTLDTVAYRTTGLFFYGVSFVMGARNGDALIRTYKRYRAKFLRGRYNHVDMIVDPSSAKDLLYLIFDYLERGEG